MKCALVKKYAICKEEGTKDKVMVPCLRWWRVRWQSISMCLVRSWKTKLWAIWIELWLSQYIGVGWEKKTLISASNQCNQTISLVVDAIAEAKGNWTQIPNWRNWREDEIPKQLQTQNRNTKYQIAETEEKMKYQNNCRDRTELPNCRSWRKVKIPDFAETEDKISLQIKLQKLKRRWNTKIIAETEQKYQIAEAGGKSKYQILQKRKTKYHSKKNYRNWTQIPNCRNWREDEIPKQLQRHDRNTKLQKLKNPK